MKKPTFSLSLRRRSPLLIRLIRAACAKSSVAISPSESRTIWDVEPAPSNEKVV